MKANCITGEKQRIRASSRFALFLALGGCMLIWSMPKWHYGLLFQEIITVCFNAMHLLDGYNAFDAMT